MAHTRSPSPGSLPPQDPGGAHRDPTHDPIAPETYRDALVGYCLGFLSHHAEAEDVAQEVLSKVATAERPPISLRAWLYRAARNRCLNVLRDRARRGFAADPARFRSIPATWTGNLTRLVRKEQQERVIEALASLAPETQEVLRLRYADELTRAEIAEVLGLAESSVKSRLYEGLRRLRELGPGAASS